MKYNENEVLTDDIVINKENIPKIKKVVYEEESGTLTMKIASEEEIEVKEE